MYKKEQYRCEALEELTKLQHRSRENTMAVLSLAKRVGLSAYGRENIALLDGDDWWDFMETHSQAKVDPALRKEIQTFLYQDAFRLNESSFEKILSFVSKWIRTHKVLDHV